MSGKLVEEVLEYAPADLRPAELMVYLVLAENARDKTRRASIVDLDIARKARVSLSSVYKAQTVLRARGLIRSVHPTGERRRNGWTQAYILTTLAPHHRNATVRPESPRSTHKVVTKRPAQSGKRSERTTRTGKVPPEGEPVDNTITVGTHYPHRETHYPHRENAPRGQGRSLRNPPISTPGVSFFVANDVTAALGTAELWAMTERVSA